MMWGHQFLAEGRVAERNRAIAEVGRVRRLLGDESAEPALRPLAWPRRSLARLMAGAARTAWTAAARLDPESARARLTG